MSKNGKKSKGSTAKVKQLEAELVEMKQTFSEALYQRDMAVAQNAELGDMVYQRDKYVRDATQRLEQLAANYERLETTNLISAEGLRLERDELLTRARRLELRIMGLGFDV